LSAIKKKQFPPNNLTSFYREQNMRKKTFTKKTINRCYNPPPSNTAVATYNNQSAIGKNQKVLSHHRKKKNRQINAVHHFVLTFRADHYFKKQKKLGDFGANKKSAKIQKPSIADLQT